MGFRGLGFLGLRLIAGCIGDGRQNETMSACLAMMAERAENSSSLSDARHTDVQCRGLKNVSVA